MSGRGFIDLLKVWVEGGTVPIEGTSGVPIGIGGILFGGQPPVVRPSTAAVLIGGILQFAFGFLAIVFIIMVLYAGFEWMTSKGDVEKIEKHKTALIHATLGLLIALLSFSFTRIFATAVFDKLGLF